MPRKLRKKGEKSKVVKRQESTLRLAERDKLILQWRIDGYTHEQIADALPGSGYRKITTRGVGLVIEKAIAGRGGVAGLAKNLVEVHLMRLEGMYQGVSEDARNGNTIAISAALSILDRQARLLGLDAPTKVQTEEVGKVADAKASLAAKLEKMSANMAKAPVIDAVALPELIESLETNNDG